MHHRTGVYSYWTPLAWHAARRDAAAMKSLRVKGGCCGRCPGSWVKSEVLPVTDKITVVEFRLIL
jgi:hypothetical protein